MFNLYGLFQSLQPAPPLQAGTVTFVDGDVVTIELPGGGILRARGQAELGKQVFVRDGLVEGVAGSLQRVDQEV